MLESWNLQKSALHLTNIAAYGSYGSCPFIDDLPINSVQISIAMFNEQRVYQLEQFVYLWDPLGPWVHELIPTDTYQQLSNEKVFLT